MRRLFFALAVLFSAAAYATPAVVDFKNEVDTHLRICKINSQTLIVAYKIGDPGKISEASGHLEDCIKKGEEGAKGKFAHAVKSVKNKAASEKLKAYYALWISALRSLEVRSGDSQLSHRSRVSANDQRLSDAWAAFEVESAL